MDFKRKRSRGRVAGWLLALLVLGLLLGTAACTREEMFVGTYEPVAGTPPELAEMTLELRKDGEGVRRVRGEELAFHWEARGSHVRIHTRSGGIILARLKGDLLEVALPGHRFVLMKKKK